MKTLLLLAGTAEARALAARLAALPGLCTIASLAGVTSAPAAYPVETRTGGFGGADGLADWLRRHGCATLIDATHPYAAVMQTNAAAAARACGLAHLRLLRPPWPDRPSWTRVPDAAAAAAALPPGARVLLTSGRKDLAAFAARTDTEILVRTIEEIGNLPGHLRPLVDRPPFTVEDETRTMRAHRITHLVTKNSGGAGTAKLDAAEGQRITTIVIARPSPPAGDVAATVQEAVDWLHRQEMSAPRPGSDDGTA